MLNYEDVIDGFRGLRAEDFDDTASSAVGVERLYSLTDALMALPTREQAVPVLFAVMERLSESDLGAPGPLVHALERMDYAVELAESLSRRPTALTVWMVNRLLNSPLRDEKRRCWLDMLQACTRHPQAGETARASARRFLEVQARRSARGAGG